MSIKFDSEVHAILAVSKDVLEKLQEFMVDNQIEFEVLNDENYYDFINAAGEVGYKSSYDSSNC